LAISRTISQSIFGLETAAGFAAVELVLLILFAALVEQELWLSWGCEAERVRQTEQAASTKIRS
jgi:hypothetical protein